MGQSASCYYWLAEGGEAYEKNGAVQVDDMAPVKPPPPKSPKKAAGSPKTQFRPSRDMRAALKAQEDRRAAQDRWHKTKADWEASVIAEMEERERERLSQSQGHEPDVFAAGERLNALQLIREEEEQRKRAEADGNVDDNGNVKGGAADVEVAPEAATLTTPPVPPQDVGDKLGSQTPEVSDCQACDTQREQHQAPQDKHHQPQEVHVAAEGDKDKERVQSVEEAAARRAIVDAFLTKNGFDGVATKRRRTLRPSIYPLHLAAEMGDAELIALLLEFGADASQKDSGGRTPTEVAKRKNRKGSHEKALTALAAP